jgi:membrane protease YdiL (CAAX protease family)
VRTLGALGTLSTSGGLAIAWGGTALLISTAAVRAFGDPSNLPMAFAGQALMWALAAAVIAIVVFSYRIVAFITAGVVEELLFRGYTITRLTMLTGNVWLAGAVALAGFAALHVPSWGWGFAITGLIGGVFSTAFFIWKKDLLAMMMFHAATDAIGFVISPTFSEWWKEARLLSRSNGRPRTDLSVRRVRSRWPDAGYSH